MAPAKKAEQTKEDVALNLGHLEPTTSTTGFGFTKDYKQGRGVTKFEKAVLDANYPWVIAYGMDQGEVLQDLSAEGKHVILLVKGNLRAERKTISWCDPYVKIENLNESRTGRKQLPVRAHGKYEMSARAESEFVEGHVCLEPHLAYDMVESGRLRFYMEGGKAVAKATVLALLDETKFQRTSKKGKVTVIVTVPNAGTSQVSKAIQTWFYTEWSESNYKERCKTAKPLDQDELKKLYAISTKGRSKKKDETEVETPDASEVEGKTDCEELD